MFGESGSGKTVLLSSFYGAAQEPQYLKRNLFRIVANNIGQGNRLHKNYLGMRDSAQLPQTDHFTATSHSFSVKLKDGADARAMRAKPFDALRLTWHDYPGEWFEQDVSGPEEARRRVDTFRSLLRSDVALLLIDGQRLQDNSGQEERYLKALLTNFRNGLLLLKDDLLEDGKPLAEFPRIWVMALSKADLLADLDVFKFRDLLIGKVSDEIEDLRRVLSELVEGGDALSVGEDFVLLSSAKFDRDRIEVTERIGLELILPLAAMLPFERHLRWAQLKLLPGKMAEKLISRAKALVLAAALLDRVRLPGRIGLLLSLIDPKHLNYAAKLAGDKLREAQSEALAKRDYMKAALTGFRIDLENGEKEQIFIRSPR